MGPSYWYGFGVLKWGCLYYLTGNFYKGLTMWKTKIVYMHRQSILTWEVKSEMVYK